MAVAHDGRYPLGRVGMFQRALADAQFDDFNVATQFPTDDDYWPTP